MNKRIIVISALSVVAIANMVHIGLAQEPIFLPFVVNNASTTVESTATPTTTSTDTPSSTTGIKPTLFFDGALAEEATIVDCTLLDGTETTCYSITIAGTPANHDVRAILSADN